MGELRKDVESLAQQLAAALLMLNTLSVNMFRQLPQQKLLSPLPLPPLLQPQPLKASLKFPLPLKLPLKLNSLCSIRSLIQSLLK